MKVAAYVPNTAVCETHVAVYVVADTKVSVELEQVATALIVHPVANVARTGATAVAGTVRVAVKVTGLVVAPTV